MASTINGTSTGSGGLISTGDDSGILNIQTNETTAITVDASQKVGIGTASPTGTLEVVGSLKIKGTTNTSYQSARFYNTGTGFNYINIDNTGANLNFGIEGSAGGGIMTGSTAYAGVLQTFSNTPFQFGTNGTTRMTLDTSGNLLVGATSFGGAGGFSFSPSASAPRTQYKGSSSSNTDTTFELYSTGASAFRFYVGYGGTISATSTTISGISDQRLKENIRDLDDGLDKVMALKPRKFDWKQNKGKGIVNDRGFIAQEFEQVFPDMIEEWLDPAPEGEEPYKAINANLIPTLVKAIQELKAINDTQAETINALTARIVALEQA